MKARLTPVLLLLALLLACPERKAESPARLQEAAHAGATKAQAAAMPPHQARRPVLLIGVDGVDPEMVDRLAARRRIPVLARLMSEGAHGILYSEREIRSPALWTTMATGRPREVHGIYDFVTGTRLWPEELRDEDQHLVTSNMRDVPAIWNMVGDAGRRVAVVGWLNTWPAEHVNGIMVSPYVALGESKQITIKGAIYEDESKQVSPEGRWPEIRALVVSSKEVPDELVGRLAPPPPPALAVKYPHLERYRAAVRWSLAHTLTIRAVTLHLLEHDRPDLTMAFFEGADSLGHRFWLFREPASQIEHQLAAAGQPADGAAQLAGLYGQVVEQYYEVLDEAIGTLLAKAEEGTLVIVVSDHGFGAKSGRWPINPDVPFDGEHRLEGFIAMRGPDVAAGGRIYGATLYDIAPTVLEALGMTPPRELEGQVLEPSDPDPDRRPDEPDPIDSPFDSAEVERLKSLGYVQ